MADPEIPNWLKSLPLAPVYRPTETEFADPIAFISRIEKEASKFGICKVIPPLPKPSKRFVLSNLNSSLSKSPELGPDANSETLASPPQEAVFTTRHQELGSRRTRSGVHKKVWHSGEVYTLEQFEAKSKAFARTQLGAFKDVSSLLVETLFWKAASEKPIYIEYANDVPGSGFGAPEEPYRYYSHRRKRKRRLNCGRRYSIEATVSNESKCQCPSTSRTYVDDRLQKGSGSGSEMEGTAGWKLSNSPWNLQVIARSPGSLTRFMPDEVPGVTSPMVYIGMLFSWFAWHVEDHELHSMNFLHMGSPKTWYAVPGDCASTVEEIVRMQGYGGNIDRLAAFTMLGEKTTLLSPEVFVASGIPCCRLVQNPGEFVVTFPRAYHVGFSHGFNCGEAANFATAQWLKVAKEAAVRRAAMNYLPMLSHQQLLYMLTMSFVSRIPRALLPGARSSRLRDRKIEEREILVKKAFLNDMLNENHMLHVLLVKEPTCYAVLWEPELLPPPCNGSQSFSSSSSLEACGLLVDKQGRETIQCNPKDNNSFDCRKINYFVENVSHEVTCNATNSSVEMQMNHCQANYMKFDADTVANLNIEDCDLPCGLNVDSGTLACVACGILGYPFMSVVQPSEGALKELFHEDCEETHEKPAKAGCLKPCAHSCLPSTNKESDSDDVTGVKFHEPAVPDVKWKLSPELTEHVPMTESPTTRHDSMLMKKNIEESSLDATTSSELAIDKILIKAKPSHQIGSTSSSTMSQLIPESSSNLPTTSCLPIISVSDSGHRHITGPVEHDLSQNLSLRENTESHFQKATKVDLSNGLDSCGALKEFGGVNRLKDNLVKGTATIEEDSSNTIFFGTKTCYNTDSPNSASLGNGVNKTNKKWNTSNGFLRPRIFCLQHALEIVELLCCKGSSAHVLIICHSDYLKIKAHAMSVAEETGMQFNCKDLPMDNASQEDLHLINISIDDEDHEESGEDWTSKLGLNLRYCVKLRKQSPSKQNRLSLALGGMFSDPFPVSAVSSLKWHSRKSRTHYKVTNTSLPRSRNGASIEKVVPEMSEMRNSNDSFIEIPVSQSCKGESSDFQVPGKHRGHARKDTPKEFDSLITIPIQTAENLELYRVSCAMQKTKTAHEVCDSTKSCERQLKIQSTEVNNASSNQPSFTVSNFGSSELSQETQSAEESSTKGKVGNSDSSELQAIGVPEVQCAELQQEMRFADETNLTGECDKSVNSSGQPTSAQTVDNSQDMQEISMARENNMEGGLGCSLSEEHSTVSVSLLNSSEMQLETLAAEETNTKVEVANSSKLEEQLGDSIVYCSEMQQDILVARETNMHSEVDNVQVNSQFTTDAEMIDNSEMEQEIHSANEMKATCEVSNPVNLEVHCIAQSVTESSETQELAWTVGEANVKPGAVAELSGIHQTIEDTVDVNPSAGCVSFLIGSVERDSGHPTPVIDSKPAERRTKRERELEQITDGQHSYDAFIRSPCEGLRPRGGQIASKKVDIRPVEKRVTEKNVTKRLGASVDRRVKGKGKGSYMCDLEGCRMSFTTRGELCLHKLNRCTFEGCGKRFSSHKYAMRHQRVHIDERPLKCPWKGCNMSFKWAWARTEHVRVHTGERPYKCKVAGCGQTFRFVSDFSRHRRKTGHSVNSPS